MVNSSEGNDILDYSINTHDGFVVGVEFLQEIGQER